MVILTWQFGKSHNIVKLNVCHLQCKHGFPSIQYSKLPKILQIVFFEQIIKYLTPQYFTYSASLMGYLYLADHRSPDCGSTDHMIFMLGCNKNDVTDRLYHCNSPQLLIVTSQNKKHSYYSLLPYFVQWKWIDRRNL